MKAQVIYDHAGSVMQMGNAGLTTPVQDYPLTSLFPQGWDAGARGLVPVLSLVLGAKMRVRDQLLPQGSTKYFLVPLSDSDLDSLESLENSRWFFLIDYQTGQTLL